MASCLSEWRVTIVYPSEAIQTERDCVTYPRDRPSCTTPEAKMAPEERSMATNAFTLSCGCFDLPLFRVIHFDHKAYRIDLGSCGFPMRSIPSTGPYADVTPSSCWEMRRVLDDSGSQKALARSSSVNSIGWYVNGLLQNSSVLVGTTWHHWHCWHP